MDSIIEDCNSYHISLLKVILILIGKDIDLTKNYKIIELNDIFNDISSKDLIQSISNDKISNVNDFNDVNDEVDDSNTDNKNDVVSKIMNNDDEEDEEVDEVDDRNIDTKDKIVSKIINNDEDDDEEIDEDGNDLDNPFNQPKVP